MAPPALLARVTRPQLSPVERWHRLTFPLPPFGRADSTFLTESTSVRRFLILAWASGPHAPPAFSFRDSMSDWSSQWMLAGFPVFAFLLKAAGWRSCGSRRRPVLS